MRNPDDRAKRLLSKASGGPRCPSPVTGAAPAPRAAANSRCSGPAGGGWPVTGLLVGLAAVVALGAILVVLADGEDDSPGAVDGGAAGVTGPDFHSLAADPARPGRLFVGGHQAVSESTDGGASWTRVRSLDDADAMGWGFADGAVFVSGHPGLNRSGDGAATFTRTNGGLPGTDVHAFGAGRDVLYGAAVDGGLFASTDGGATWEVRAADGTQAFFGRIVVDPGDDDHLFAADAQRGVAESTDGGRSWTALDTGLPAATWLTRSPDSLDTLIASGPAGAARSTDAGRSWEPLDLPAGTTLVEIAPPGPTSTTPASTTGRLCASR